MSLGSPEQLCGQATAGDADCSPTCLLYLSLYLISMESDPVIEQPRLILASGSPRRARIIDSLGIPFKRVVTDVDETLRPGADPAQEAERLARLKGETAARGERLPVLAADTIVVMDGVVYGKPASPAAAERMLGVLQGRFHEVRHRSVRRERWNDLVSGRRTQVELARMSSAEIREYVLDRRAARQGGRVPHPWPGRRLRRPGPGIAVERGGAAGPGRVSAARPGRRRDLLMDPLSPQGRAAVLFVKRRVADLSECCCGPWR